MGIFSMTLGSLVLAQHSKQSKWKSIDGFKQKKLI